MFRFARKINGTMSRAAWGSVGAVGVGSIGWFSASSFATAACDEGELTSLSKSEWKTFRVSATKKVSPDTSVIRFKLPSEKHTLGMDVASCLSIQAEIDGQMVSRPYTPISTRSQQGYVDFVVKAYPPRKDGKPGGMGRHLNSLYVGQSIQMKGPWSKFPYVANKFSNIGMVAGGTGLTPMLQIVHEILYNPEDRTKITLLYGNNTVDDILLRDRLDSLAELFPDRFKVVYTVASSSGNWTGETVFYIMNFKFIYFLIWFDEIWLMMFVCGPPPMMKAISGDKTKDKKQGKLSGVLKDVGYDEGNVFKM
eukprot:GSMAST32.ASY1.ANO1.849.1 assembled CDS